MERLSDIADVPSRIFSVYRLIADETRHWVHQERARRSQRRIENVAEALRPNHTSAEQAHSSRVQGKGIHRVSYSTETDDNTTRDVFWVMQSKKNGSMHVFEEAIIILENGCLNEVASFRFNSLKSDPTQLNLDEKQTAKVLHQLSKELQNPEVVADLATDIPHPPLIARDLNPF